MQASQIKAQGVSKSFGQREVVKEVSLNLGLGEVVGLLGPNGAGKTTTFYMLLGIIRPSKGQVFAKGVEVTDWPLHDRARHGMSYLPQESSVFRKLTVRQNLEIILEYCCSSRQEVDREAERLLQELGIAKLAEQKAIHLSGGERRRLEIARALIRQPDFMLLDEPFAGIDPLAVDDIQQIVVGLKDRGIGVLISDHNVRETLRICNRAYLVHEGKIILEGTPGDIVSDAKARKVYLGEKFEL
jgi:lipopolysaccharide export system ATP-binding protein